MSNKFGDHVAFLVFYIDTDSLVSDLGTWLEYILYSEKASRYFSNKKFQKIHLGKLPLRPGDIHSYLPSMFRDIDSCLSNSATLH